MILDEIPTRETNEILICAKCGERIEETGREPEVYTAVDSGSNNFVLWYDEHDCETDET